MTDFDREYALKLPEIRRDIADGGVLGIESTPTYFINGVRLPNGLMPAEYFELAIKLELAKVKYVRAPRHRRRLLSCRSWFAPSH